MKRSIYYILLSALFFIAFSACEDDDDGNETNISSYNSDDSHKAGQDCMTCHVSGGSGEGWFTVAGTVYDEAQTSVYPNATVKIYSEPNGNGNLIATIEVDENGNFYTTEAINFGDGLYTLVEGNSSTQHMITSITTGRCNSCHGSVTDKIWVR